MKTTKHILLAAALCLCSAFNAEAAYNGTPATPKQISDDNYATYGFTAETYSDYVDWYAISTAEELYGFATLVNNRNSEEDVFNGVLTSDIVVNENVLKADGTLNGTPTYSWTPIGTSVNKFAGKFDGQGHTISGLYFNDPNSGGGLFGCIEGADYSNKAEISNTGVVDSYIKGYELVGGVCGSAMYNSIITNCFNAGAVTGKNDCVGGVCGYAYGGSVTITSCHNTGTVMGKDLVGGICGHAYSTTIANSYNTGKITGSNIRVGGICGYFYSESTMTNCYNIGTITGGSYEVGGICGYAFSSSTITNCYYLTGCAKDGNNVVQFGIGNNTKGKTTADVSGKTKKTNNEEFASGKIAYLLNGSVSGGTIWYQNLSGETDAYPVLDKSHDVVLSVCGGGYTNDRNNTGHNFDNGICTICGYFENPLLVDDWLLIDNAGKLYWFAKFVNSSHTDICGKLTADIMMNENVLNANGELNGTPIHIWTPIGTNENKFAGKFDGQGHTVSGLYFSNTTNGDYPSGGTNVGLFGYVRGTSNSNKAEISNVGVVDSYIKGYQSVGSICGRVYSTTITNCYNTGKIMGNRDCVGGICGYFYTSSTLTNCYNTGNIAGSSYGVGGISGGTNSSITTINCYYLVGCAKDGSNVVQIGIGNGQQGQGIYYDDIAVAATAEEFASGKIAYLLNGSTSEGDLAWYQTLFDDATPVLDPTHNIVAGYVNEVDNVITVNGDLVISSDYEIAESKTFVVLEGSSVTITSTGKITNNGTISNNGTITNNGTLVNNNVISGNNLAGAGNFAYTNLSDSDIEIASNGYAYKGTAYTLESGLADIVKARTICGKQFIFDATGYSVSYENNINVGDNAKIKWEGNSTVEKTFAITPNTNVVVTITGNSSTVAYNTEEQGISGYTVDIEDATGVYTENDITFSGSAAASGTTVGTYAMELSADDFSNTNTNFAEVQFVVTDGVLTINKAENAPDMPTTIETYYINTNRVALPDSWQWVENIDLEKGDNTATAQYVGDDADNYENVSVEVVVTRTACPHDEGYTTINTAEPTCTEEGYTGDHLCNICNEIFEQGESIEANGHTYSNTVTAPTCTEIGFTTHTCSVCEYTYNSDTIAVNGHTEVIDAAVAATCTAPGKTEGKHCSVCEAVLVAQEEVAALGHNFGEYVYNNDATTTADGTETATCSRCGEKDTRTVTSTKLPEPQKGTAVTDAAASTLNIYAHGNTIVIENAAEEICVYNAMGALVERVDAVTTTPTNIKVNIPGVFIVKTGRTVKRVIINEQ